jgi:hypothetical protein
MAVFKNSMLSNPALRNSYGSNLLLRRRAIPEDGSNNLSKAFAESQPVKCQRF